MSAAAEVDRGPLAAAVEAVAAQLVRIEHRRNASFVSTPALYPSGATVVVQVASWGDRYVVSDMSAAFQEATAVGASHVFQRHAKALAEEAGILFDGSTFKLAGVTERQLPGAMMEVASCSKDAAGLAILRKSEDRTSAEMADEIYEKLERVFPRRSIHRNEIVIGHSHTEWNVSILLKPDGLKRATVFQPVKPHHLSIAHASMMLGDISRSEAPPNRVIVVPDKAEFGTYLGVLVQVGSVVDRTADAGRLARLATSGANGNAYPQ